MHPGTESERYQPAEGQATAVAQSPRRIASTELLRGKRRTIIQHGEVSYTLVLTRNDKLILTK